MLPTSTFREKIAGLSDLLNWAALIDDGIILQKDGSLLAGWYYRGSDINSATPAERNALRAKVNAILARLGSGWMAHIDAIRLSSTSYPKSADSHFPDSVTAGIDNERRMQYQAEGTHYESVYVLTLTYTPPLNAKSSLQSMMVDDGQVATSGGAGLWNKLLCWLGLRERKPTAKEKAKGEKVVNQFRTSLVEIEEGLSSVIRLQRLLSYKVQDEEGETHVADELLQYINGTITGDFHPVKLPPCPMYLDAMLGMQDFATGVQPRIGNKYIAAVTINGFPQESFQGILASLDEMPFNYRWSTRFIYMDAVESVAEIKKFRRQWQQKVRGFFSQVFQTKGGAVDLDAAEMVGQAESALAEASSGLVKYGYYTNTIIILDEDPDRLEQYTRDTRSMIQKLGFTAAVEDVNAVEAWLGSLPGQSKPNVRRPMLHTMQLADMLPLTSVWPGAEFCPSDKFPANSPALMHCSTEGATPFRLNLHVDDLGHSLILGPTGAGKSTLLAIIAAQFRRYPGSQIFSFDKGNSLLPLTKASGGLHFDVGRDESKLAFCPLATVTNELEQAWAEGWVETLIQLQLAEGERITPTQRNEIHRAMTLIRESGPEGRSLTDFVANLQDRELSEALKYYTVDGPMGHLLDAQEDGIHLSRFVTFEIEELMNLGEKSLIPVLLYLFHRIELQLDGSPTLIPLDEAWLMLGHPVFREKIREWLKVLRKANAAVLLSTQSISDAVRSGILDVLIESCPTKILLPNEVAQEESSKELYKMIGLNDRQVEIIAHATRKRDYYYLSPLGKRLFNLNLGPYALAFVGSSGKEDIARIRHLEETHGEKWPAEWLREKGVDHEAYV